ncbi:methionyl-tRNA formyltransferase [Euzebya sp.]|uniref:methionyl-tRNA formyltransferase n=1 Tax=Euzebya sp. TaxID=1971409 RepID=UPI003511D5CC
MRIAFFGTPAPAVPALEAFVAADDVEVVAVVTNPDRPAGRGYALTPPPVKVAALDAGLDVWQPTTPREVVEDLRAARVDACAVVAYGSILPQDLLDAGGAGFVNLHFSLLPAHRGAAPVPASILAGDTVTGVTCFRLDAGMDTGDVLVTHETRIAADETAGELTARLAEAGAPVLVDAVRGLVDGTLPLVPQDHDRATYAPKIAAADAALDWAQPAAAIDRAVRAFNPMPGAHTTLDGSRLKVHRVTPTDASGEPGHVVGERDGRPVVACGEGAVRLDEVQPAGKPRMDGAAFANGYRPTVLGRTDDAADTR